MRTLIYQDLCRDQGTCPECGDTGWASGMSSVGDTLVGRVGLHGTTQKVLTEGAQDGASGVVEERRRLATQVGAEVGGVGDERGRGGHRVLAPCWHVTARDDRDSPVDGGEPDRPDCGGHGGASSVSYTHLTL